MRRVSYNQGDEILEVVVRDQTGSKIETRRCNIGDAKECGKIMRWLKEKYGFKMKVEKGWLDVEAEFLKF